MVSLVPTMLYRLLEKYSSREKWPKNIRMILLGGAAASPALLTRAIEIDLPVAVSYGLSETASQVATATPGLTRRKQVQLAGHCSGLIFGLWMVMELIVPLIKSVKF